MAAILCTHRAQVSLGSFPPQSRYALMLRLHKSRLGRSLPSLAMHEIADSPPTRTDGYRLIRHALWKMRC
jgi:hypothetical protein